MHLNIVFQDYFKIFQVYKYIIIYVINLFKSNKKLKI